MRTTHLLGLLLAALASAGCGVTAQLRGHAALDGRLYLQPNRYARQAGGSGPSVMAEPELSLQDDNREHTATLRPFGRFDPFDPYRTHWDIRRADYELTDGEWELALGQGQFNWGRLEGLRLVDVMNQRDLVEDVDGSQKLGQPYVQLGLITGDWTLRVFYLPYFRERTFPGVRGRLRSPLVVDTGAPVYESALGAFHPNVAARAEVNDGDLDLGLAVFSGTAREPRFLAQISDQDVVPGYPMMQQASFDASLTVDATVFKLEAVGRLYGADLAPSAAVAGGLEHTLWDIEGSGVDLTFALEYRYDYRPRRAPFTFWNNDVFAGVRLAFNDAEATEIRAGAITDLFTGFTFATVRAERRLDEHFKLFLEGRFFLGGEGQLESAFLSDQYLQARLAFYL